jgi:dienelactone hydrolase
MTATLRTRPLRDQSIPRLPFGLPPARKVIHLLAVLALIAIVSSVVSTIAYLRLPAPTGSFGIGREAAILTDPTRPEIHTAASGDVRQVRVVAWFPVADAASSGSDYLVDLDAIDDGLVASGELGPLEVAGLRFARSNVRAGATVSQAQGSWPVLLLSPGNATNVEFYGTLAEELASHGYVVIGLDHPYQVTAVALDGGDVAVYEGDGSPAALGAPDGRAATRIGERVADIRFVLDRLEAGSMDLASLGGRLDLERIGILGHSNGGVAAAEACAVDARLAACLNIDGQLAGGPFSAAENPVAPTKPFMYLTKETELHPRLADLFEAGGQGTYRVVVPAANHDQFADGPRFEPRLLPLNGAADNVLTVSRGFAVAFFDHVLQGAPESVLGHVVAPTDVLVEVYPLTRRG